MRLLHCHHACGATGCSTTRLAQPAGGMCGWSRTHGTSALVLTQHVLCCVYATQMDSSVPFHVPLFEVDVSLLDHVRHPTFETAAVPDGPDHDPPNALLRHMATRSRFNADLTMPIFRGRNHLAAFPEWEAYIAGVYGYHTLTFPLDTRNWTFFWRDSALPTSVKHAKPRAWGASTRWGDMVLAGFHRNEVLFVHAYGDGGPSGRPGPFMAAGANNQGFASHTKLEVYHDCCDERDEVRVLDATVCTLHGAAYVLCLRRDSGCSTRLDRACSTISAARRLSSPTWKPVCSSTREHSCERHRRRHNASGGRVLATLLTAQVPRCRALFAVPLRARRLTMLQTPGTGTLFQRSHHRAIAPARPGWEGCA